MLFAFQRLNFSCLILLQMQRRKKKGFAPLCVEIAMIFVLFRFKIIFYLLCILTTHKVKGFDNLS